MKYKERFFHGGEQVGVYSGEQGAGKRKRREFLGCYGPDAVAMVRKCKLAVDPQLLLNRGNVIPAEWLRIRSGRQNQCGSIHNGLAQATSPSC